MKIFKEREGIFYSMKADFDYEKLLFKSKEQVFEQQNLRFDTKRKDFEREKNNFYDSERKIYKEKLEKEFKDLCLRNKKGLKEIIDYSLFPWNKAWTININNYIVNVEINKLIIETGRITMYSDNNTYWDFFKTKKEAVECFNKRLEDKKLKHE